MADERALLEACLAPSPDLRLEQYQETSGGEWELVRSRLRLAKGLAYSFKVEPYLVELVGRCDGERLLREVLQGVADGLDRDLEGIIPTCLAAARRLVERGLLVPKSLDLR